MTPTAQGRHCAACTKTVVDFSCMTDAEVVAYLSRASGPSCGRFRAGQLSRPLRVALAAPVSQRWVAAALAVLGVGVAVPAVAQQPRPQIITQQTLTMGMVATTTPPVLPARVVRGQVTDASGQGLPGVTVLVEGTHNGTSTRADGTYELEVAAGMDNARLVFSSIGFETLTEPMSQDAIIKPVSMKSDHLMMGEMVYTGYARWYTPRGLWQRLRRPFRR